MTNIRKVTIGTLVLLVTVAALVMAVIISRSDPVSASVIAQRAEQEKQAVLSAMAQGQILYFKAEEYKKPNPGIPAHLPWAHPERIVIEIWMAEDPTGAATVYSGTTRTTDGRLLSYSELRGNQDVSTWVATGEQIIQPYDYTPNQLSGWVKGMWGLENSLLSNGHGRIGSGALSGQTSAIFEREVETSPNFTPAEMREMHISPDRLPALVTHVNRQEFVEEKPMILRSRKWERDGSGTKTLLWDYQVLEYKLLPAGTEISFK